MKKGDKVGIVCCSNGQKNSYREKIALLRDTLENMGLVPVFSDYIYEKEDVFSGTAKERAKALMDFYKDDTIKAIYDISGGDVANSILPYLDFGVIKKSDKEFWGYSDLTTIVNAMYAKTGKASVLRCCVIKVWVWVFPMWMRGTVSDIQRSPREPLQ